MSEEAKNTVPETEQPETAPEEKTLSLIHISEPTRP
mgnify:CR=1 FL=1